jgi:hypothetical protein
MARHSVAFIACALLAIGACSPPASERAAGASAATLFEGARLVTGAPGGPIENSAFLVEGTTFTRVGRRGEIALPDGASRVDLAGKTVMPAIINAHAHLGYRRGKSFTVENYTRDNIIDHLQRFAYHGVAAVMSMGAERPAGFELRDELKAAPLPGTALFLTAGRGIAMPNGGPAPPLRDAPYGVSTEAEARQAVGELQARKIDHYVKIWVAPASHRVRRSGRASARGPSVEARARSRRCGPRDTPTSASNSAGRTGQGFATARYEFPGGDPDACPDQARTRAPAAPAHRRTRQQPPDRERPSLAHEAFMTDSRRTGVFLTPSPSLVPRPALRPWA